MSFVPESVQSWLSAGLGLIYPEVCQLCHRQRADARKGLVCDECYRQIRFIRPPFCERCGLPFEGDITGQFECGNCQELHYHFTSARSAVAAKTVALEAIHKYKYSHATWFEPFLAGLLIHEAVPALRGQEWHFIMPVPLHGLKLREREFNQAARLARHLAQASNIPMDDRTLSRINPTRTQTLLSRKERAKNMHGAFAVKPGSHLKGRKVILVDDVFTTGATTNDCARALKGAGVAEVCVWTVARGL